MKKTALFLSLAVVLSACAKSGDAGSSAAAPAPAPTPAAAPAPAMAGAPKVIPETPYKPVLAPYEQARALLAADSTQGLADAAKQMEAAAKQLSASADPAKKPHYDELATAAAKLAAQTDVEQARAAFGEVSKPVVALLAADPQAQQGYQVMECPMVKGFQKWVQLGEKLENPYMGKKMLECGGKSSWST